MLGFLRQSHAMVVVSILMFLWRGNSGYQIIDFVHQGTEDIKNIDETVYYADRL